MLAVVWRLEGVGFDIAAFVARFELSPDVLWHQGQETRRGTLHETSGLSLSLDTASDSIEGVVHAIVTFIQSGTAMLQTVKQHHLRSTVDIGFTVGDPTHFTRSIQFGPELLGQLSAAGVALNVSAYPGWFPDEAVDESNETQEK